MQMSSPQPQLLSPDQTSQIHQAVLGVLSRIGVHMTEPASLKLLHDAGADISDTTHVKIPEPLVEKAIKQAPENVIIYDRNGSEALDLGGSRFYFGAHGDCQDILDPLTAKRRRYFAKDAADVARVCDALDNICFISLNGFAADCVDPALAAPLVFAQMVRNTTKPLGFGCAEEVFDDVIDVACVVVGGRDQLRARPFFYHYSEPTTPLVHSDPSLRRLIKSVEAGIPIVYTPMLMMGATAPCSKSGTLIVACADSLVGLVIAQLLRPGAPFIFGGIPSIMDMQTTVCSYGAPEMLSMVMALTDMAHFYHLPMFGTAGCTDAKRIDQQAAVEASLSCHCAVLAGANLVHDVGLIDHADMVSAEMIILTDEIISMVTRTAQPIDTADVDSVMDLIEQVGPGGHFLTAEHTLANFRKIWMPSLMDRTRHNVAASAGLGSFSEKLKAKATQLMAEHKPQPISPSIQAQLSAKIAKWLK